MFGYHIVGRFELGVDLVAAVIFLPVHHIVERQVVAVREVVIDPGADDRERTLIQTDGFGFMADFIAAGSDPRAVPGIFSVGGIDCFTEIPGVRRRKACIQVVPPFGVSQGEVPGLGMACSLAVDLVLHGSGLQLFMDLGERTGDKELIRPLHIAHAGFELGIDGAKSINGNGVCRSGYICPGLVPYLHIAHQVVV